MLRVPTYSSPYQLQLSVRTQLLSALLFLLTSAAANAQSPVTNKPPVLISETTSTRAIAFDSVTFAKEPFSPTSFFASDDRTRVMLFALNMNASEGLAFITADAETSDNQHHPLQVEFVGQLQQLPWLTAVILRLNDDLTTPGDVLVSLTVHSVRSNRVRLGITTIGGGPPDDLGAMPTPAPPYQISGRVTSSGQGMAGVNLILSGDQSGSFTTAADGFYSFLVDSFGSYTLTAGKQFFDLNPSVRLFANLSGNQLNTDFTASRQLHSITGKVFDDNNQPLIGVGVSLQDNDGSPIATSTTNASGAFSFSSVPAGFDYHVAPSATNIFTFATKAAPTLDGDIVLNFEGLRRSYRITGTIRSTNNDPLPNITLLLGGFQTALTATNTSGVFTFNNLPAGRDYTVDVPTTAFWTFNTQQLITNLSGDTNTAFTGTLRKYSISGNVRIGTDPVANLSVSLSGAQSSTATTDGNGNFIFAGLNAAATYQISPASTELKSFPPQSVITLSGDQVLSFTDVPRKYAIRGTVTDANANLVAGVRMRLTGSETATARTNSLGQYSIDATVLGDYTVTPDIEQQVYLFSPGNRSVTLLLGDQTLDFTGTLQPIPNPPKVLEFDGAQKAVDYGNFWPPFTDLGHTFWEFWAMPGSNATTTYMLSDGYGGLHALLFGFANFGASETNRYQFFGNMNDGVIDATHVVSFGSDQGPAIGEWGHFAVGWDGQNIITYLNGVPVGRKAYALPRQSTGPGTGSGRLLIGGSDHQNFNGRMAQVRGFEGINPRESTSVESSFAPETVFSPDGNLLSWFFTPGTKVADLSNGYLTGSHIGTPRGTVTGILNECTGCPLPQFVFDPTAPNFATNAPGQPAPVPGAVAPPPTASVFDSFSRVNSTYTFGGKGGLGSTEGGSAGPQLWQMEQDANQLRPFGILNGLGVVLADSTAVSWVNTNSPNGNLDVRVRRRVGGWGSGVSTGLSFRVRDHLNYFFAYTSANPGSPQTLNVGYYLDGFRTTLVSGLAIPQGWSELRVVTRETGKINVSVDFVPVYSTTELVLSRETKAGLYNNARGMALVNRWDNFAVFPATP